MQSLSFRILFCCSLQESDHSGVDRQVVVFLNHRKCGGGHFRLGAWLGVWSGTQCSPAVLSACVCPGARCTGPLSGLTHTPRGRRRGKGL